MPVLRVSVETFPIISRWTNSGGQITSGPSTETVGKTFTISGIEAGSTIDSAVFTAFAGSPLTGCAVFTINGRDCPDNSNVSVPVSVSGDGNYIITFVFKANGSATMSDGGHAGTLMISDPVLTVAYTPATPEPEPEPEPIPEPEHIANDKIAVFSPFTTIFSGNGLVTLNPLECSVYEEAGGDYELTLVHSIDDYGKWQYLIEDYLIRSPVPRRTTPQIIVPAALFWQVKESVSSTPLYSTLPYYTRTKTPVDKIRSNPSQYAWQYSTVYSPGTYVVSGSSIYVCKREVQYISPTSGSDAWGYVASLTPGGGGGGGSGEVIYHEGVIAETIPGGEIIAYIGDYDSSYLKVRSLRGVVGYINRSDCEQSGDEGMQTVIRPRVITEQVFRIYHVSVNSEEQTVTVQARHKSYDFMGNTMLDCRMVEASPQTAISIMQGSLLNPDSRYIICNVSSGSLTENWSWSNPVYAIMDPDEGLAHKLKAQIVRDDDDYFLLENSTPEVTLTLHYGANLLGVSWDRSVENVITRIVPRGQDKDGNDLFLPELFVDSPIISSYPVIRVDVLDCECKEGSEIEHADGSRQTLTRDDCYTIMRETAQKRFSVDKCDAVEVSLEVQFLLLEDTEEYKQYKGLQNVVLYEAVKIIHDKIGLETTAQVNGYEWDVLRHQYKEISLGNIFSYGGRTVTGYNITDSSVTWRKLSPGLIDKIRRA